MLLLQQISELGECVPVVHQDRLPDYAEFDPQTLYLWWTLKLVTTAQRSEINATSAILPFRKSTLGCSI